jgi:hypothetical protein
VNFARWLGRQRPSRLAVCGGLIGRKASCTKRRLRADMRLNLHQQPLSLRIATCVGRGSLLSTLSA